MNIDNKTIDVVLATIIACASWSLWTSDLDRSIPAPAPPTWRTWGFDLLLLPLSYLVATCVRKMAGRILKWKDKDRRPTEKEESI